ncbi:amidase family protein [Plantactinospora sp. KLBMP9567]|uniref:amidase family protein n=1 Tax=Plantactinospora sp. KLBMP9567 TaxID=3085900 RepID=UPI002981A940|nr:amidase family protein [Plantactinospora sp. KLBMP9567]MDW5329530.1 amidase family protein [Plantactinospora sp. KLBMP9567]
MEPTGTMSDPDPCWWSAQEAAAAIARRRISAREYLRALTDRIEAHNGPLGLVVTLDERAEAAARRADDALARGEVRGPLHGVAMTVKDSMATRGLRTTGGMTELRSFTPVEDAAVVAGLRAAGAVIFGKTNLPAGSADLQSFNDVFGTARNPWRPEYSTSGSSGGGAGAVAAGFTPAEVGSDIAGSVRLPAAACGVVGHKPTFGTVSMYGHVPPAPFRNLMLDIAVPGPMGRCVDDVLLALRAIAGPHPWDRAAWQLAFPPPREIRRVAVWSDDAYCPVDREVRDAVEQAATALAEQGITVEHATPRGIQLETSDLVFRRLLAAAAVNNHPLDVIEQIGEGRREPGAELGAAHVGQRYRHWSDAEERRAQLRLRWRSFFQTYDALLLPVSASLTIPHDHRPFAARRIRVDGVERPYWDQVTWAGLTGVAYLPSTVVPVRLDSRGLPVGVAVAGGHLEDMTTLAVARLLATLLPPLGRPPMPDRTMATTGAGA